MLIKYINISAKKGMSNDNKLDVNDNSLSSLRFGFVAKWVINCLTLSEFFGFWKSRYDSVDL